MWADFAEVRSKCETSTAADFGEIGPHCRRSLSALPLGSVESLHESTSNTLLPLPGVRHSEASLSREPANT